MKNVYDIKKDENLTFVLSDKYINNSNSTINKREMAVIIHLHYEDTVKDYFKYIINIPQAIDIFITVSDSVTKLKIAEYLKYYKIKNCIIIDKKNRGRDISALLVACREIIIKYQYVCFIHDKKEKSNITKKDIQFWIEGLWENTLGSTQYIYNVKELFNENEKLGVLVPPNPITDQLSFAVTNTWYKNFNLTKQLASELNLNCDISENKPPITLGTVFWCRVAALKKLFLKEWKYEDFQEEPLDSDGTISHAIERILAYVAQDAGYLTGNIMTDAYAGKQFEFRDSVLMKAFNELNDYCGIANVNELYNSEIKRRRIENFCNNYNNIFIYGTGLYGSKCFRMMQAICKEPKAFLVSDGEKSDKDLYGISVYEISEIILDDKCGIIMAVSLKYVSEIMKVLIEKNIKNYMIYIEN